MNSSTSTSNEVSQPLKPRKETSGDYYGKLIDLPFDERPNSLGMKAFTVTLIAGLALSMLGIETIHQVRPFHNKELTIQLDQLASVKNKKFETLFLGDSVTQQPFRGVSVSDETLMLANFAGVTVLGNELIARRFYEQGNTAETVILSFSTTGLLSDENNPWADTLFHPIFRKSKERELIKERTGEDRAASLPNGLINDRVRSLTAFVKGNKGVIVRKRIPVPLSLVEEPTNYPIDPRTRKIQLRAENYPANEVYNASDRNIENLVSLVDYIESRGSKVTFLIPPHVDGSADSLLKSRIGDVILKFASQKNIQLINVNDIRTYPLEAFNDGVHLHTVWEQRFLNDMAKAFPKLGMSQGDDVAAYTLPMEWAFEELPVRNGFVVKRNGTSGLVSSNISLTLFSKEPTKACISARTLADSEFANSVRLTVNYAPQKDWHFQLGEKSLGWRWVERKIPIDLAAGWNEISIIKREGAPINSVRLKACKG